LWRGGPQRINGSGEPGRVHPNKWTDKVQKNEQGEKNWETEKTNRKGRPGNERWVAEKSITDGGSA